MGTSTSSSGPGSGVPFDPPWLNDNDNGDHSEEGGQETNDPPDQQNPDNQNPDEVPNSHPIAPLLVGIAPPRRFANARRSLGKYASEGGERYFRKALGHYSKTGMGGASRLATRMRPSATTAANIVSLLTSASSSTETRERQWLTSLYKTGVSPNDVVNEIVGRISPEAGGLEEDSCRDSMANSLSEFIEKNDNADLLSLTEAEVKDIAERFLAHEAYNRLMQDMGQLFERSKITPLQSVKLRTEMKEYLRAEMALQLDRLWGKVENPSDRQLTDMMKSVIENTFRVYEDEV